MKIESSFKLLCAYNKHSRLQLYIFTLYEQSWCFISASHGKSGSIVRMGKFNQTFMCISTRTQCIYKWNRKKLMLNLNEKKRSYFYKFSYNKWSNKHSPTNYYLVTQMLLNIDLPLYHCVSWLHSLTCTAWT